MGQAERLERLALAWRVLLADLDQAIRWRDQARITALSTALRIIDACQYMEEGADRRGERDRDAMARVRQVAAARDILKPIMQRAGMVAEAQA